MTTPRSRFHFIAGLPRSGSTLLSAILRQNPRFAAGVSSPVAMLFGRLVGSMSDGGEYGSFFTTERRSAILKAVIEGYYAETQRQSVIFDTNRGWTARMPLIRQLFPDAYVICCVRNVSWIIDSVERLIARNALQPSKIFDFKSGASVYHRVDMLMKPDTGLIGLPWSTFREAWFGEHSDKLLVVNYDAFVEDPSAALAQIYAILGEDPFPHDIMNVAFDAPDYDASLGTPGLHRLRPQVALENRNTCLPPDLFAKYGGTEFWKNLPTSSRARVVC